MNSSETKPTVPTRLHTPTSPMQRVDLYNEVITQPRFSLLPVELSRSLSTLADDYIDSVAPLVKYTPLTAVTNRIAIASKPNSNL